MKLTAETLGEHLRSALLPVYVQSGDDPLLAQESLDQLRARAVTAGYSERTSWNLDRGGGANWDAVLENARGLSLFAARRCVEVRLTSGKPGAGAEALQRLIDAAGDELLVLIVTGRLDRAAQSAAWLAAAERRGALITLWPVGPERFGEWLRLRFQSAGLSADSAAIELLAARTEGNLLAARQEVEKLALLLAAGARVSAADVEAAAGDSARYSTYKLPDVLLAGDARRALAMLEGLLAEGTEPTLINWALLRAQRMLQSGEAPRARRLQFARLTARAVRADRMAKGQLRGDVREEFRLWAAELCGLAPLPLTRSLQRSLA